jgi:hypothetical protein
VVGNKDVEALGGGDLNMMGRPHEGLNDGMSSGEVNDGTGSRKNFGGKFWQSNDVSESLRGLGFAKATQRFIFGGTTVATDNGDVSWAVAAENHSRNGRLLSSVCC